MKVLMVTNVYPNEYGRSDGVFVQEQVMMLENMGINVDVLYIDLRSIKKKRKWGMECYKDAGVQIYHYSFPCGPIPFVLEMLYLFIEKKALYSYFKKEEPSDVIHGHFYMNGFWAKKIQKKYSVKYVLTEHSSELYSAKMNFLHKRILARAYNDVSCLIGVSDALKSRMSQYTEREIIALPNVLSKNFYYKEQLQEKQFNFLCIGHLIENKGVRILLESFVDVQRTIPNVRLIMVGAGKLKSELEQFVKDNSLDVEFKGEVSHEEIPEICWKCQCFVLPSRKETFGVSYIEAMACGLPVIATKCGGPEGFVNENNGILIPIDNKDALVDAMIQMYKNYLVFDKQKISEEVLKKYGYQTIRERLMQIYGDDSV